MCRHQASGLQDAFSGVSHPEDEIHASAPWSHQRTWFGAIRVHDVRVHSSSVERPVFRWSAACAKGGDGKGQRLTSMSRMYVCLLRRVKAKITICSSTWATVARIRLASAAHLWLFYFASESGPADCDVLMSCCAYGVGRRRSWMQNLSSVMQVNVGVLGQVRTRSCLKVGQLA